MAEIQIKSKLVHYRQQIIETLFDLISIPTVNPPGQSYKECVDYLSRRLSEWGIEHEIIAVPDGDYPRFSILDSFGKKKEALHFHGHYDVVPTRSPEQFEPCLKKDRLFGRGSSDMKGGLVTMLFALRLIKENNLDLNGRISFSIVPDEETGGHLGIHYLIESGFLPQKCLGMLMPEPTSGIIWKANKGALTLKIEVKGKSSHVGLAHQGVNAFENMVRVVNSLFKLKKDIEKRKTSMAVAPPQANRSVMLIGGESGSGVTFNLVPDKAFFTIDRRFNPEENLNHAKQEIMEVLAEQRKQGIEMDVEVLQEGESSIASSEDQVGLALKHTIKEVTGKTPQFELCPGLCEIRFFNKRRIPAYAYGPGLLEVSHGPNEYVKISNVLNCTLIYTLVAQQVLS
jgi:acetylornithine deacetylase/succinyl-diaminopimelate desuccinylase family protein